MALKALEGDFSGRVKCIYIDPPFNTQQAFEHYDDGVEHSLWLSLMRDRMAILFKLLALDGTLFVHIDDNELGGGPVSAAAQRLAADVRRLFEILGDRELQQAFGARDAWGVIEQVSASDLGGARNTARYRTLSEAGSRILGWLADHAQALSSAGNAAPGGAQTDADLVDAVEQWLAASGVSDDAVEELSQPGESPRRCR